MAGKNRGDGDIDTRCPKALLSGGFIHLDPQAMQSVSVQTSSHGTVCTNLRAQLHRMQWGQREDQSHYWTQLLREKHIPQTGEEKPQNLGLWDLLYLPPANQPKFSALPFCMFSFSEGEPCSHRPFHGPNSLDPPLNRYMPFPSVSAHTPFLFTDSKVRNPGVSGGVGVWGRDSMFYTFVLQLHCVHLSFICYSFLNLTFTSAHTTRSQILSPPLFRLA